MNPFLELVVWGGGAVIHSAPLEDRRIHPLAWGYVACEGGCRAITRAELAQLSTAPVPIVGIIPGYPQERRDRHDGGTSPLVSGLQPVDNQ